MQQTIQPVTLVWQQDGVIYLPEVGVLIVRVDLPEITTSPYWEAIGWKDEKLLHVRLPENLFEALDILKREFRL